MSFFRHFRKKPKYEFPKIADNLNLKQRMKARMRRVRPLQWQTGGLLFAVLFAALCLTRVGGGTATAMLDSDSDSEYIRTAGIAETSADEEDASDGTTDFVLDFVGDLMLGRYIREYAQSNDYASLFANVSGYWAEADLVFANLESAVLGSSVEEYELADKNIHLYTDYEGLTAALDAGVNVFACANNHAFDYGEKAILELCTWFNDEEILYSGIGTDMEDAATYTLIDLDGISIAFISITEVFYLESLATESQGGVLSTNYGDYNMLVYQASEAADLTIVYIHWGEENYTDITSEQETLGHRLIDAGADIVIGCHPHVLQEVELYEDGIIFYSLGNFIFDVGNTFSRDSLMVEYTYSADGTGSFVLYPLRINDGIPSVTTNFYYKARIYRELTQGLSSDDYYENADGYLVIPFNP